MLTVLALSLLSLSSAAQETPAEKPDPSKEELVCKTSTDTGTRLRRSRVCKTKWQAKLDEERAQREVNGVRGLQTQAPPNTPF